MKTYPCYIYIDETDGYVFSTGMDFKTFAAALRGKARGLLLLKGFPRDAVYDRHTSFEYVPPKETANFIQEEDVYDYGDFCWVDFSESKDIAKLTDEEIAALLFAAHLKRPLGSPFFDSIGNQYLYLCHDDDYWVKVYMQDIKKYKLVIEQKIRNCFMGKKRSLAPIPSDIIDDLFDFFKSGAVFDFENSTVSSIHTGVRIFPTRNIGFCADDIHKELDHQRNIGGIGKYLEYNPKTKKWSLL